MNNLKSFSLGILAAIGALFLEILLLNFSEPLSFISKEKVAKELISLDFFFFSAIFIEELLKYFLISKFLSKGKCFVFSSFLLGLGFSLFELILIYWNYKIGIEFEISGIIGVILIHIATSVIIAYSIWKNIEKKLLAFWGGFIPAIIIHSLYNIASVFETEYQNKIIFTLLIFLAFLTSFLLIKSTALRDSKTT